MSDTISVKPFGRLRNGEETLLYTLSGENGAWASVTDYGASLVGFSGPSDGIPGTDIALSCESATALERDTSYIGAMIGRVAGRIGGAGYEMDGKRFNLTANTPPHHLHGGATGLGKRKWTVLQPPLPYPSICFTIISEDGDEGYPGEVRSSITYTLLPPTRLVVEIRSISSAPTPYNPTLHAYFNLDGHAAGSILHHELQIFSECCTLTDADLIPTGEIVPVDGLSCDFRHLVQIGVKMSAIPTGFDQNFLIDGADGSLRKAAIVQSAASGRRLTVWTDRPCIHLYTGHFLAVTDGKDGAAYDACAGFALETQGFPDAVNHSNFPVDILRPGDVFFSRTIFELDQDIQA